MNITAVGNYPKIANRPDGQRLRRAIAQFDEAKVSAEELARIEDEVTTEVIGEQIRAGLDLVTDGQIRWDDGQTYFARHIEGMELAGLIRYFDTNTYYRQPVAKSPLGWCGPISVQDYQFASAHSSKPVKPVITGPYTLAKLSRSERHSTLRDFVLELAHVLCLEAQALEEAGASLIQIDEPAIVRNKGDWPLFQDAMKILTQGLSIKMLLYTYFGDVTGLEGFFHLPFQGFGLDFVTGPSNFSLLKEFPQDKDLGLGIVDARNVKLESGEEISRDIQRALQHVSWERLYVNPSCGLDFLPREQAYAKLERMVERARAVEEVRA